MKYLVLVLVFLASGSFADSINLGFYTVHNQDNDFYNNNSNLISIEIGDYVGASFNNSYGHDSFVVGKKINLYGPISLVAGGSYGYDSRCINPVDPNCPSPEEYKKDFNLFASLLIQKQYKNIQFSWLEAIVYRNFSVGYVF